MNLKFFPPIENNKQMAYIILMTTEELKKWRDFRTYDWKKAFPAPDMEIRQIKELLSLV
jgi:hypothetical protein